MTKKCAQCGKTFETDRSSAKFCSTVCAHKAQRGKRVMPIPQAERDAERKRMMARLAERDAAYAAAYPTMAGGMVRGRVASGGHCGTIRNDEINVAVSSYIARTREM